MKYFTNENSYCIIEGVYIDKKAFRYERIETESQFVWKRRMQYG